MIVESIAEKVKRIRKSKRLSQYRLAKNSGLQEAYISQLESGRTKNPRRDILAALARGLGVSPSVFFEMSDGEHVDAEIKSFLTNDLLRRTINMVRERKAERDKYKAGRKEG